VDLIGTANVLRRDPDGRWSAANFDGVGFVDGLAGAGHAVEGLDVFLAGAGGAGSAIAVALLAAGAGSLAIQEVDDARATSLLARLAQHWPDRARRAGPADLATAGLVVNATPLGLRPDDRVPIDPTDLAAGSIVADIIMDPPQTQLLRLAAERGLAVHDGIHMLHSQIARYHAFFGWTPGERTSCDELVQEQLLITGDTRTTKETL
jgi:shikimate dehydrogenase